MFDSTDRRFTGILKDLERFVADLAPEQFAPADIPAVLGQVLRAEKLCGAARMLLAATGSIAAIRRAQRCSLLGPMDRRPERRRRRSDAA